MRDAVYLRTSVITGVTEMKVDLFMSIMIHFLRFQSQSLFSGTTKKLAATCGHGLFCVLQSLLDFKMRSTKWG